METRIEEFSGQGKKPDEFAIVEVYPDNKEGNTYPRYTKRELKNSGWGTAQKILDRRETEHRIMIKQAKLRIEAEKDKDYSNVHPSIEALEKQEFENCVEHLKHIEGIRHKIIHFKYKAV